MPSFHSTYWSATRHPWSCLLFVVPLLLVYEIGLHFLGPTPVDQMRNGADVWLRTGLAATGVSPIYGPPIILLLILLTWTLIAREQRPGDPVSVWTGMVLESVFFAVLLYGLSRCLWPLLHSFNGLLEGNGRAVAPGLDISGSAAEPTVVHLIRYLGAGLYEETLFRLLLFSGLLLIFHMVELPRLWGVSLAIVGSALLFAGAHNLGANGEPFRPSVFIFRSLAGAYFACLYSVRGFGIAVGAHAGYDVLARYPPLAA